MIRDKNTDHYISILKKSILLNAEQFRSVGTQPNIHSHSDQAYKGNVTSKLAYIAGFY